MVNCDFCFGFIVVKVKCVFVDGDFFMFGVKVFFCD